MHLFQFHLFRVSVPLMMCVSFCKDYVDLCNGYNGLIQLFIMYYHIQNHWNSYLSRRYDVCVNIFVVWIEMIVADLRKANIETALVTIVPALGLVWKVFYVYSIRYYFIELEKVIDKDFIHIHSFSKRARLLHVFIAILALQTLMFTSVWTLYASFESVVSANFTILVVLYSVLSDVYLAVEIRSDVHLSSYFAKAFSKFTWTVLPFFLYFIKCYNKHTVDKYRKVYDITDIVFLYTDFKCIISFAWKECTFSLWFEAKKYRSIMIHYYDIRRFLMYCLSVTVSAWLFIWLCSFAFTLFATQNDPMTHITPIVSNTTPTLYARHEKENIYERHLFEDVRFKCDLPVSPDMMHAHIMWIHNSTVLCLKGSERIQVNENRSEIRILLIDHMDYGDYQCVIEYYINTNMFYGQIERKIYNSSTIHRLKKPISFKEFKYVDIAGLVWFKIHLYFSFAEEDDISFNYTVNGEDVNDICTVDFASCSWTSLTIKNNYRSILQDRLKVTRISAGIYSVFIIDLKTCICRSMYGLHEIVIYRNFFNTTTLRNTVVEIVYPVKYYFYPKHNDTVINDKLYESSVPNELIRSILKGLDELMIPSFLWFSETKVNKSFIINSIFTFVCFCVLALCVRFLNSVIRLYCCVTIAPFQNRILLGPNPIPRPPLITNTPLAGIEGNVDIQFDVYLSSSEEDDTTAMSIVTFLETDCGLRVKFARDMEHEGNERYFNSFSRATEQCRKFIVILSNHYIEDEMCYDITLISCIIPLIHSTRRQGRDLIFLKLDRDVEIPVQIMFDPAVTIINYTTDDIQARWRLRRLLFTNQFN